MMEKEVIVSNVLGLHARAVAKLVNLASQYPCRVFLQSDRICTDAKSILGILAMQAGHGTKLKIKTDGEREGEALSAMVRLFEGKFGEER